MSVIPPPLPDVKPLAPETLDQQLIVDEERRLPALAGRGISATAEQAERLYLMREVGRGVEDPAV